jgi:hypothetical protein
MKSIIKTILLSGLFAYSQASFSESCAQSNITLNGLVGLDYAGNIYASTSSNNEKCSCTSVRFREGNTDIKAALSILLAAKMADKKVRIDLLDKTDCNTAARVYIH